MKKMIMFILCTLLSLSLFGCAFTEQPGADANKQSDPETAEETKEESDSVYGIIDSIEDGRITVALIEEGEEDISSSEDLGKHEGKESAFPGQDGGKRKERKDENSSENEMTPPDLDEDIQKKDQEMTPPDADTGEERPALPGDTQMPEPPEMPEAGIR